MKSHLLLYFIRSLIIWSTAIRINSRYAGKENSNEVKLCHRNFSVLHSFSLTLIMNNRQQKEGIGSYFLLMSFFLAGNERICGLVKLISFDLLLSTQSLCWLPALVLSSPEICPLPYLKLRDIS